MIRNEKEVKYNKLNQNRSTNKERIIKKQRFARHFTKTFHRAKKNFRGR